MNYLIIVIIVLIVILILLRLIFGRVGRTGKKYNDVDEFLNDKKSERKKSLQDLRKSIISTNLSGSVREPNHIEEIEDFYKCRNPFIRNASQGEKECRKALCDLYPGYNFKSCRPDFLRNPDTGFNLELDCYESTLRVACEYQGKQHYEYIPFFHKKVEDFEYMKENDFIKAEICKQIGVYLIRVPYTVKKCDIKQFIVDRLNEWKNKNSYPR